MLDPGDILLGTRSVAALATGASSAAITMVTVPATTVEPAACRVIAGPAPAGGLVIRFFLSADDQPDASDVLLGTRAVGGLGAGLSCAAVMSVTVPASVAAGAYRIVAVADAAGRQVELDETNDVAVSPPLTVTR